MRNDIEMYWKVTANNWQQFGLNRTEPRNRGLAA